MTGAPKLSKQLLNPFCGCEVHPKQIHGVVRTKNFPRLDPLLVAIYASSSLEGNQKCYSIHGTIKIILRT